MSGFLTLRRGDTFVANAEFAVNGVAQDMTDWTLEATLQFSNCAPVELAVSWLDQAGGVARVRLHHEDTQRLQTGEHELRVRAISPVGDRSSCNPVAVMVS